MTAAPDLPGSPVMPPHLDEYLAAGDYRDRVDAVAALSWIEADLGE